MSLAAACGWSLARSLMIAIVALPLCRQLQAMVAPSQGWPSKWTWAILLLPFITPDLLVGYAYALAPLDWRIRYPVANELLFSVLLFMKCVPVGTVVLRFAPPPAMSPEAMHCLGLSFRRSTSTARRFVLRLGCWLRGPGKAALPATGVMFLIAFQEFELASRLQYIVGDAAVPAVWTVNLYDAQVRGLPAWDALKQGLIPLLIEVCVLGLLLGPAFFRRRLPAGERSDAQSPSVPRSIWLWGYLLVSAVLVVVIPAALVLSDAGGGFRLLLDDFKLTREILTSTVFCILGGIGASVAAAHLLKRCVRGRFRGAAKLATVLLVLPGLCGSLILSLMILSLIQLPVLSVLRDNRLPVALSKISESLPLIGALILWLLPRAMLLQLLLQTVEHSAAVYAADLLLDSGDQLQRARGLRLSWRLKLAGHLWAAAFVCYWGYWELTATSILMPVGMVSAPVLLYNLMHYSHPAVLSAMLCVTIAFPLCLILLAMLGRGALFRWLVR
jgi:ABC-type Fe3+ transport system permease subunit